MNTELLLEGARGFGLELDATAIGRFRQFMAELQRWNRSINLTAITRPDEIVCKHFVDSLSIVPLLAPGERLLDIGSGAGLPGLAVAILRHDVTITSLDAVDKKVRFQRHICRLLGLRQVEVLHGRVEGLAVQQAEEYDVVTSRAFRDVGRFAQLAHRLVRPGGRLLAMLAGASHESSENVAAVCERYGLCRQQEEHYRLARGMGERNLLVLKRNQL